MKHNDATLVIGHDGRWRIENKRPPFLFQKEAEWSSEVIPKQPKKIRPKVKYSAEIME